MAACFAFDRGVIHVKSPSQKHGFSIRTHGAHVSSFTIDGKELFYLSNRMETLLETFKNDPKDRSAIRGGIPLIFPQFGPGKYQNHGFARNVEWTLAGVLKSSEIEAEANMYQVPANSNGVIFELSDNEYTKSIWPYAFLATFVEFEVVVDDSGALTTSLHVKNTGSEEFSFQTALHTYFAIDDINKAYVTPLKSLQYIDKVKGSEIFQEDRDEVTVSSEVDRVYLQAPEQVYLHSRDNDAKVVIKKSSTLPDVVVWNPWVEKNKSIKDMNEEDFKKMICIETGAIKLPPLLQPNESWSCAQVISLSRK